MTGRRREQGNLQTPLTRFVGRRAEIAEIRRLMRRSRLITLTGVGGVGKTRLAIEVARDCAKGFRDGVWFVDFSGVGQQSQLAGVVATTLRVPDQSARAAEEQLAQFLGERELLVVLDNCEHVLDDAASLAERLLSHAAGLRLVVTSREALGVAGEQNVPVAPLSGPEPDDCLPAAALESSFDAVELFLDRARAVRPDFAVTESNGRDIARLCVELDGLPLAIELAASRLRTLDVAQIVERLADRFTLLTGGSRTARTRQRTLRGLIAWSYDLCAPKEQLLWQRLSVFPGGFDLAAVEGVCGSAELPVSGLLDLLDGLVAQSVVLIEGRHAGAHPRYRMLETIRAFGREWLDAPTLHDLRTAHRDYHLRMAERLADEWIGDAQAERLHELRLSHVDLRAALEWSITTSERDCGEIAHRLFAALRFHWCMDGFLSEGRRWLERILPLVPHDRTVRGRTLWVAGWVSLLQGDQTVAEAYLEQADETAERVGNALLRAQVRCMQGTVALFRGKLPEAIETYDQALSAFADLEDDGEMLFTMFQLALALAHSGDPRAESTARASIELATRRHEKLCRSYALWALGYVAWSKEDWDAADRFTRAGLAIQREYNDPIGSSLMMELLACVASSRGDHESAGRLLGAVRAQWRSIGSSIANFGPQLAREHARCERAAVEALRAERWQALMAEGGGWDLQRALAEVLGERQPRPAEPSPRRSLTELTPREREVAGLVAEGMRNRDIASALTLSLRTIDGHVENILAKLGFNSRTQIAVWMAGQTGRAAPE